MARPPKKRAKCPESNKIRFSSEKQALAFGEKIVKKRAAAYQCDHCGAWHMTMQHAHTSHTPVGTAQ